MRRTKTISCPECGHILDAVTTAFAAELDQEKVTDLKAVVPDSEPEPGSLTMCVYCTQFLVFDMAMELVPISARDFKQLPADLRGALHRMRRIAHESFNG